jgi:hypothetical protein
VRPYYHFATERDFPEWKDEYGQMTKMVDVKTGLGAIFRDHSSILLYNLLEDPDQERSAKSIAKFSQKDADSWRRLMVYTSSPGLRQWVHNPPVAAKKWIFGTAKTKDSIRRGREILVRVLTDLSRARTDFFASERSLSEEGL